VTRTDLALGLFCGAALLYFVAAIVTAYSKGLIP
jgi:hypothetical protein